MQALFEAEFRERITIRFDKEALKSVSSIAAESDVSIARVIRHAADKFLEKWKEGLPVSYLVGVEKRIVHCFRLLR